MSIISIELVARSKKSLQADCSYITGHVDYASAINVPHILKYRMTSYNACRIVSPFFEDVIPHIRSRDFTVNKKPSFIAMVKKLGLQRLLFIRGDLAKDSRPQYTTTSTTLLHMVRSELPHVKIYAALDPYRSSLKDEMLNIQQKHEAGFDGFFTQPFFDLTLLETYQNMLGDIEVFWGLAPVLTESAQKNYWEKKNNVVFPYTFRPTMEWNRAFGRNFLQHVLATNTNCYIMPIGVPLEDYLPYLAV